MNYIKTILLLCLVIPLNWAVAQDSITKERVIVLTDIEADPDDTQSLVRLLLYSNSMDIKGLVATTSCWRRSNIAPESIRKVIRAYGQVHSTLKRHESGFPSERSLLSLVKDGLPVYGMQGVGDGKNSEGSDLIIQELEKNDPRPLWISVWGGVNTLAQALFDIEASKSEAKAKALISKLRVYTISDQDDAGVWIRKNFPDLFYIVSPGDDYASATWNAINTVVPGWSNETISNRWIAKNIQQNHGPLGAVYPDVAWGLEGDTPAFLGIIPNGLNHPEHPEWGGWGGRYELYKPQFSKKRTSAGSGVPHEAEVRPIWTDTSDKYTPHVPSEYGRTSKRHTTSFESGKVSLWRWRDDFQNDFAARMDWTQTAYKNANHPPVPVLNHPETLTVKSGEGFELDASNSTDPDGDSLSFLWLHYPEAGTYKREIPIENAENSHRLWINTPKVSKEVTTHFILKVIDKGTPALTRYKRVIVTIVPK